METFVQHRKMETNMRISSGEVSAKPSPEPTQTCIEDVSKLFTDLAGLSSSTSSPTDLDLPTMSMDDFGNMLLQRSSTPPTFLPQQHLLDLQPSYPVGEEQWTRTNLCPT
ncbi:hypothetical protein AAFF_G00431330 [Aldrovandia affinis]|uniref:Uncharacterized protein n=1 Tax=Aldrovandia affinis TaxID=143900 RepID=A0AAD7S8N5_9TELE|nr:hypothetical protein AAFF_G00431330 [Aldrovandia affinis]